MTKKEAAELLGVSERAINRYVTRGRLTVSYQKNANGSREAVFDADQVKTLKQEIDAPAPAVKREPSTALSLRDSDKVVKAVTGDQLRAFVTLLETTPRPVPIEAKLTLTLRDASKLSGLSRSFLLEAIKQRKLKAAKRGRGWNILRRDLDAWVATKLR